MKRIVSIIEMHQIVIVRRPGDAVLAWCSTCLKEVEMATLDESALLAGVSPRDICRRVGADDIHFAETANGGLICLNSLLNTPGTASMLSSRMNKARLWS